MVCDCIVFVVRLCRMILEFSIRTWKDNSRSFFHFVYKSRTIELSVLLLLEKSYQLNKVYIDPRVLSVVPSLTG